MTTVTDFTVKKSYRKKYIVESKITSPSPLMGILSDTVHEEDIELDLCYITDRMIVMGSPYTDGKLNDVRNLFEENHPGHLMIVDLASDEDSIEQDFQNVEPFNFNVCNPCALAVIIKFCSMVQSYLDGNPQNVVAVHCKTGKGKSCMLVACYLLHSGIFSNSSDVIAFICRERTPVLFNALSVPSQIRYVNYYETLLRAEHATCFTYEIDNIRMNTVPSFNSSIVYSGCTPFVSVSVLATKRTSLDESRSWYPKRLYNELDHTKKRRLKRYDSSSVPHVDFRLTEGEADRVRVRGDVVISLFSTATGTTGAGGSEKMCQLYFNTCFIEQDVLYFDKTTIDMACKDNKDYTFASDFSIEVSLHKVEGDETINDLDDYYLDVVGKKEIDHMYMYGDTVIEESDEECVEEEKVEDSTAESTLLE